MRTAALLALAAAIVTATAPANAAQSARGREAQRCALSAIRPYLSTQGTATQTVTFVLLRNPEHLTCSFSEPARFVIEQNGRRAPIAGNPLMTKLSATLTGTKTALAHPDVWWANWCGARAGLLMVATIGGRTITGRFRTLPVCLNSHDRSTFSTPSR
jgi:hypothetical protein